MFADLALNSIMAEGEAIQPIEHPVAEYEEISPIMYSTEYREAISCLRALMAIKEYSERALKLTGHIISLNPAHYTVWTYRADCLFALGSDLSMELKYIQTMAEESSKNYQLWHHREVIVRKLGALPATEKEFLDQMLAEDAKNYHVWCYRQWLCRAFPRMLDTEDEYTKMLINEDVYNNSAWNHRFFASFETTGLAQPNLKVTEITSEIEYVKLIIDKAPDNQAAWAYLQGICKKSSIPLGSLEAFATSHDTLQAIEFRALIEEEKGTPQGNSRAKTFFETLEQRDTIRQKYWKYRASNLNETALRT